MSKYGLDYSELAAKITKKAYRLEDVKDQLETVAFDIVRFKDHDKGAELWQIQSADDGDYIVALYDDAEIEKTASSHEYCASCGCNKNRHKEGKAECLACKKEDKKHPCKKFVSEDEPVSVTWDVKATKSGSHLQISYKGDPIVKLSSDRLGIPPAELHLAEQYLPEKLSTNKRLVKALLSELNDIARQEVSKRYPELI